MRPERKRLELHPSYLRKGDRVEFVVLPIEEFEALQEVLEDVEDLLDLRDAREADKGEPTLSMDEVKQMFDL